MEGAGVRLKRVFGFHDRPLLDPFLLLDHFGSANPQDYMAGFPWHPHRGIETVTYMLNGSVEHGDSMGNKGVIRSGDVQWMTAGSGIVHQEMPHACEGAMQGFQLWVNLPASHKMMAPRYRGIEASQVPAVTTPQGAHVKVVAGRLGEITGPATELIVPCTYFDVHLDRGASFAYELPANDTVFGYVFEGEAVFGSTSGKPVEAGRMVLLGHGDRVNVAAPHDPVDFLLISGRPLNEPIAWGGPIVMNTQEELATAFEEYRGGTFLKHARH
jgi:hypothetical protein